MKTFFSEQLLQISLVMLAPITTGIAVLSNELLAQAQTRPGGSAEVVPTPGTTSTKATTLTTDVAQVDTTPTPAPTDSDPSPDIDLDPE